MKDREIIKLSALILILVSVGSIASIDIIGMSNAIALVSVSAFLSIVAYSYSSEDTYLPLIGGVLALGIIMGGVYAYGGSQALGIAQSNTSVNIYTVEPPNDGEVTEQSSNHWKIVMDSITLEESVYEGTLYDAKKTGSDSEEKGEKTYYWVYYKMEFEIEETSGHWMDTEFNSGHRTTINVNTPMDYSLESTEKKAESGDLGLEVTAPEGDRFTIKNNNQVNKGLHSITVKFTIYGQSENPPGPPSPILGGFPLWVLAILVMPIIGVVTYFGIQRFGGV